MPDTRLEPEDQTLKIQSYTQSKGLITPRQGPPGSATPPRKVILAIQYLTTNYQAFNRLAKQFGEDLQPYTFYLLRQTYQTLKPNKLKAYNNFYKAAPIAFLQELSLPQLFGDLIYLLRYDKDKWLIDNSDAMIKALSIILAKENGMAFLYDTFNAQPALIKELYHHLDNNGQSAFHNGSLVPNKTLFTSMLAILCNNQQGGSDPKRNQSGIVFSIVKNHRVDSNLFRFRDQHPDRYDLVQQSRIRRTVTENIGGYMDGSASIQYATYEKDLGWQDTGPVHSLHPLDLVTLVVEGQNGEIHRQIVPAILVKDLAHHREWAEIERIIRIGMDIFVVAVSLFTLFSGAGPLLTTISVLDLGLSTADIGIQTFEKEIQQLEGGPGFLETWNKLYALGGLGTSLPLIGNLLHNGTKVLARLTNPAIRQQLVALLTQAMYYGKHLPRFLKGELEFITDYSRYFILSLEVKMETLAREGVYLAKGIAEGKNTRELFLMYRDVVLRSGTLEQIVKEIQLIIRKGKKALPQYLRRRYYTQTGSKHGFWYLSEVPSTRIYGQEQPMSCAAACIRQIAKDNGVEVSEEMVRKLAKTDGFGEGTELKNISKALNYLLPEKKIVSSFFSIDIYNFRNSLAKLERSNDFPMIVSIESASSPLHTVILDKVTDGVAYIRDPGDPQKGYGTLYGVEAKIEGLRFINYWLNGYFQYVGIENLAK